MILKYAILVLLVRCECYITFEEDTINTKIKYKRETSFYVIRLRFMKWFFTNRFFFLIQTIAARVTKCVYLIFEFFVSDVCTVFDTFDFGLDFFLSNNS